MLPLQFQRSSPADIVVGWCAPSAAQPLNPAQSHGQVVAGLELRLLQGVDRPRVLRGGGAHAALLVQQRHGVGRATGGAPLQCNRNKVSDEAPEGTSLASNRLAFLAQWRNSIAMLVGLTAVPCCIAQHGEGA